MLLEGLVISFSEMTVQIMMTFERMQENRIKSLILKVTFDINIVLKKVNFYK